MSLVTPLIGRKAKLGLALQAQVDGVPDYDQPAKVETLAKFAMSNLQVDDKKVFADNLEDRASEYDGAVVGTSEPAGDIELNAQEDGAILIAAAAHWGDPTTSDIAQANPFIAYKEHLFKNTHDYRCATIVERVGIHHFIYWGCRVNRFALSVRKTQDRVVFAQCGIWAYNHALNKTVADEDINGAGVDTGMASAALSSSPHFAAVRAILNRAGSRWAGAQDFNFVSDAQLVRTEELDGYRGMPHYSPGKKIQADVTLYFSTDAEYKAFTGNSATDAEIFGPGYEVIEEDLELVVPGNIRGVIANNTRFQPEFRIGLLRGAFISPIDKQIGKEAIMLKCNIQVQHKTASGTDSYFKIRNTISNAALIAAGDDLCNIPANAGSAYTAAMEVIP
jgi:hypothetical protein